jgi:hypothetical protein
MLLAADPTSESTMSEGAGARQVHKSLEERFAEEEELVLECERVLIQEVEEDTYFGGDAIAVAKRVLRVFSHRAACDHDALGPLLRAESTSGLKRPTLGCARIHGC